MWPLSLVVTSIYTLLLALWKVLVAQISVNHHLLFHKTVQLHVSLILSSNIDCIQSDSAVSGCPDTLCWGSATSKYGNNWNNKQCCSIIILNFFVKQTNYYSCFLSSSNHTYFIWLNQICLCWRLLSFGSSFILPREVRA